MTTRFNRTLRLTRTAPWATSLLLLATCSVALAQSGGDAPKPDKPDRPAEASAPPDHIGHTRHTHRRGQPHDKAPDAARFTTNRSAAAILPLPAEQDAFFFVVFGDRTGGPVGGVSVLADAVRDVNLLEPDLVMTVGDLVQGYNQTPEWLKQMTEFKGIMDQLLCPWFPVAGNHDVYWRGPKGAAKPPGENDQNYETHFGPLWYAFEHKNCWFVALYSDEGDPQTGEKAFNKPEAQRMSPAQFDWLRETLEQARGAEHVFLFLHHPRWLKGGYGDDWDRVHELLKSAGNVTAVFAGHIHHMRYDGPQDGIEYVTLATVGGEQSGRVPAAGYLHQFHVVTVRKRQIALAAVPVGKVMDVREITGEMVAASEQLAALTPDMPGRIRLEANGSATGVVAAKVTNPIHQSIDVLATLESSDSRWFFTPEHEHLVLKPGDSHTFEFQVRRMGDSMDAAFRPAELVLDIEYLAQGARYPMPQRRFELPLDVELHAPPRPAEEVALACDGRDDFAFVPAAALPLPDGPLTLECWFRADGFGERTGLVTKTENSDYGIFVSQGKPAFSVFIGPSYLEVRSDKPLLQTGRWQHVAGVYDGKQARLYVNGKRVASADREGSRRTNPLPLMIGADVTAARGASSFFDGQIDALRLSDVARYSGEDFTPQRRFEADEHTWLLLNMDGALGPWLYDESSRGAHATLRGGSALAPAMPETTAPIP